MAEKKQKMEFYSLYLGAAQLRALTELSKRTRVPRAVIVRFAIDLYLRDVASADQPIAPEPEPSRRLLVDHDEPPGKTLAEVFADQEDE